MTTLYDAGPVRLPREARRIQLMNAALEVFVSHGYHCASMDQIADQAGVSKPVLYQHFPGKLDLYLALLDIHALALVTSVRTALSSTNDNRERVERAIGAYVDFVDGDGGAFRLLFECDLLNEAAVCARVEAARGSCLDAIAEVVAADTSLPLEEARLLAVGLTGIAEIGARSWFSTGGQNGPISKQRAVDLLTRLSWRGIGGYPPSEG